MAPPVNQQPSAWAVYVTLSNGERLFWDYVEDDFFAWGKGVFLCWQDAGIWKRIVGVDQYPPEQAPDPTAKLVNDCIANFNTELNTRWPVSGTPPTDHPLDSEVYAALRQGIVFNSTTQRFEHG